MAKSGTTNRNRSSNPGRRAPRRTMPISWPWIVGGVALVLLVVFLALRANNAIAGVQTYPGQLRTHTEIAQTYPQTPPVGGAHSEVWQNCGVYDKPIRNEHGVHSLEHGAVWITYRPDLSADGVAAIRNVVSGRAFTLVSPYPGLPSPVVATAWGIQLKLDDPTDPRLAQFLAAYVQGPQTPEPGAPCSGGTIETVNS